jgi:uncharacterized repeat protein (TIGR01451 family)
MTTRMSFSIKVVIVAVLSALAVWQYVHVAMPAQASPIALSATSGGTSSNVSYTIQAGGTPSASISGSGPGYFSSGGVLGACIPAGYQTATLSYSSTCLDFLNPGSIPLSFGTFATWQCTGSGNVTFTLQQASGSMNVPLTFTISCVGPATDLRLTKQCQPDGNVFAGSTAICEIYVDNLGPADAQVGMVDQLTGNGSFSVSGVTVTSTSGAGGSCTPTSAGPSISIIISCSDTSLPAGARNVYRVSIISTGLVDVDDTATATTTSSDSNTSNNLGTGVVHFVPAADLTLTKTAAPNPIVAGRQLTYTLTVHNNGPSFASAVRVSDLMPVQVTNLSWTSAGNSCNAGSPGSVPLTCDLGNIAAGATETVVVVVVVKPDTSAGTVLFNNGNVSAFTTDLDISNNAASVSTNVTAQADVQIAVTSDSDTYKPNSKVTYHVIATNQGPSDAQNVVITDVLPDAKQAIYLSDNGACVFQAPKTLTCSVGKLAAGSSRDFYVYVTVKGAQGDLVNSITAASSTPDPVPTNNTGTKTVTIKGKS